MSVVEIFKTITKLFLGKGVSKSYSQFGEDAVLQAIFRKKKGTYVDIGSYHPILYSNTYALYRKGWSGIAVDPNPNLKYLYTLFRPRDIFLTNAIGEEGQKEYVQYADGAYNTLSKEYSENSKLRPLHTTTISVKPLRDIIKKPTDLLCIDAEGMDLEILRSHDWHIKPTVVVIEESNSDAGEASSFLRDKGYTLIGLAGMSSIFRI